MNTVPYQKPEGVAEGLWLLPGRPRHACNAYVMGDVLVDAATRHATRRILAQVRDLPIRTHVLTHAHLDHMGASHDLCRALDVPLLCGEADVAAAESGGRAGLREKPWPVRVEHRLLAGAGHPVAATLKEGDRLGDFTVLEVPGHSPGHLAFWRVEDRVLVLGDVLFNLRLVRGRPGLRLPPALLTADPDENLTSARRIAALDPAIVCFGHGPPLRYGARMRAVLAAKVRSREARGDGRCSAAPLLR
jgi:glyoxylase-like metal-dependent hydrolase (beta-lactamase superfamily II)